MTPAEEVPPGLTSDTADSDNKATPPGAVLLIPIHVTIGDGLKFGCGFLIPFVLALLVAFIIVSVLIVASVVAGTDLPFGL